MNTWARAWSGRRARSGPTGNEGGVGGGGDTRRGEGRSPASLAASTARAQLHCSLSNAALGPRDGDTRDKYTAQLTTHGHGGRDTLNT